MTYLENDFNITRNDNAVPLPPGEYNYHNFNLSYSGDNTRNFSINGELSTGKFYNGNKFSIQTKLNYRIQPIFQSSFISMTKSSLMILQIGPLILLSQKTILVKLKYTSK